MSTKAVRKLEIEIPFAWEADNDRDFDSIAYMLEQLSAKEISYEEIYAPERTEYVAVFYHKKNNETRQMIRDAKKAYA